MNDDNASVLADILPEVRRDTLGRRVPESKRRPAAFHAGKHKRGDNAAAATRARQDDKAQAQIQVLGYLRQGLSPEDAMLKTGRAGKTFYTWTRESTKFRVQQLTPVRRGNSKRPRCANPGPNRLATSSRSCERTSRPGPSTSSRLERRISALTPSTTSGASSKHGRTRRQAVSR